MFSAPAQLALAFQKYSCTLALLAKIAALNHFLAPLTCAGKDPPQADLPAGMEKGVIPPSLLGSGAVRAESCGGGKQLGNRRNYLPDTGSGPGKLRGKKKNKLIQEKKKDNTVGNCRQKQG